MVINQDESIYGLETQLCERAAGQFVIMRTLYRRVRSAFN